VAFPEPKPGFVVRYDYLWTHEAAAGRDQGKDRPACLVAASDSQARPRFVVLLPITHTPPDGDTVGIEIPAKVKQAIGLDDVRSWVIVSEHNIDEWPNAGLSPISGKPRVFAFGFIPPGLFAQIKIRFLELARQTKSGSVRRCLREAVSSRILVGENVDFANGLRLNHEPMSLGGVRPIRCARTHSPAWHRMRGARRRRRP
jgi:hypothetical protein